MKVWRKIILSYEAHFRLDGLLISKIFVFGEFTCDWRKTNAPATRRCLVRILAGGIIGPYFFENEAGQAATINRARYRDMITILSVEIE